MKPITRPTHLTIGLVVLLLYAGASALGGEPREPMPTAPTLYYACMSTGGRAEYDSAAFASKNPGADYQNHYDLNVKMMAAFDAYLTQKYGFHGLVNCGRYNTLAEAQQWLQWRESESRAPGKNYQYFTTDWTYDGAAGESEAAAAATTPTAATTQAGQSPAAAAGVPTVSFICIATSQGTAYESAIFEASNDAGTARRIMFTFAAYLSEKYKIGAMPVCRSKPTRAAVEAFLQEFPAGVQGGVSQHVSTGWVYK
jgi:hypothetical protein